MNQTIIVHDTTGHPQRLTKALYEALRSDGMLHEFHPDAPEYWPLRPTLSPPVVAPPVVAFTGAKFSGKGTAARFLIAQGYQLVSFARPLKEMLIVLGLKEEDLADPVLKEQPHPLLDGKTPRWAMQSLGTEWGREMISDNLWVAVGSHRIDQLRAKGCGVVVDDCRFDNEALFLSEMGVPIIEITRQGCPYNPTHKSEAGISRRFVTATVANDSTVEDLYARLRRVLDISS